MRRRSPWAEVLGLLVVVAVAVGAVAWIRHRNVAEPATIPGTPSATSPTSPGTPSATSSTCAVSADGIPRQPGAAKPLLTADRARAALAGLRVAPRASGKDFCRGAFGPDTWPDLDRNGCSTRQDVLVRSAVEVRTATIRSHGSTCLEAMSGTWVDAYTGARLTFTDLKDPTQASRLQIDHLVSLYEAWVSGARSWTPEQRVAFANDLAAPELWAVSGQGNFDKSHRGLDSWSPSPGSTCRVTAAYVQVKAHWRLSVTAAERARITELLAPCP